MTVLITGGTGNTGLKLAHLLRKANIPVLITSRNGTAPDGFQAVRFDWFDHTTFSTPFEKDSNIDKIYVVIPRPDDVLSIAKPFIDLALEKGVKHFVLVGGRSSKRGRNGMGEVLGYLDDKNVDHALLKPTYFLENFSSLFVHSINMKNEISSAAGDGRIPFIAAQDIARAALEVLTSDSKERKNSEPYILGPELFTYDEVTAILSEVTGRKISYRRISGDELTQQLISLGFPKSSAEYLTEIELSTRKGADEEAFNAEDRKEIKYIGKKTLREYFEEHKDIWAPAH